MKTLLVKIETWDDTPPPIYKHKDVSSNKYSKHNYNKYNCFMRNNREVTDVYVLSFDIFQRIALLHTVGSDQNLPMNFILYLRKNNDFRTSTR